MAEVFRDERIHVLKERCSSCIFRTPKDGQIMGLAPGRISNMVREAQSDPAGNIPCHSTIYDPEVKPAICRGFYDLPRPEGSLLEIADLMGVVEFDDVPDKKRYPCCAHCACAVPQGHTVACGQKGCQRP